jgi:arabinogalactan oligomer / maltooligosaccharide transport system permease protein
MRKMPVVEQIARQIALVVIGFYVILPIWSILRLAFDSSLQGRPTEFRLFPKEFSFEPLLKVLDRPYQSVDFWTLFSNSLLVSFGAALAATLLGAALAYAFARFRFAGRNAGLFIILLTAVLPMVAFTTPFYILLSTLGIRTELIALVIVYAAFAMPFCIWNMRAAFQSVPRELEEAAMLDGAGHLTTFTNITLPIALPSIAIAALLGFLTAYSEFTFGWLFVERADTVTLAMAIYAILASGSLQPWSQIGALMLVMSVPVVIIFILFQYTLLETMLFGGGE